jgi:hypothetical protein
MAGIVRTRKVARILTEIPPGTYEYLRLRRKWKCDIELRKGVG